MPHTFEVTIQRGADDRWPVVAEQTVPDSSLRSHCAGELLLDSEIRQALLAARLVPKAYGTLLGEALFRDEVRDVFVSARAASDDDLRVLLDIEDPDLRAAWRWKRLCAPLAGGWDLLALHQQVPFSLYLPSAAVKRFPPIGRLDLRALVVAASPLGLGQSLPTFDVGAAIAGVQTALGEIPCETLATGEDGQVIAGTAGPATLDTLCERITAGEVTLLHLVCHGAVEAGETVLFLAKSDGAVDRVTATRLMERLEKLRRPPYLAFLASCESASADAEAAYGGLAQRLVRGLGMPAVVAMTERVTTQTANALAATFYARLRKHGEPDRALVEATAGLAERGDVTVPALFSRLGGYPLFTDDRTDLTPKEIAFGLDRLREELSRRAPALLEPTRPEFARPEAALRATLGADPAGLSGEVQRERRQALDEIGGLCLETTDLAFKQLALGQQPPPYNDACPFRGLSPFRPEDHAFFFGREPLIARLSQKLGEQPFLPVLGPSGSGKSSLVLAGLIPTLIRDEPALRWADFEPGVEPLTSLDGALGRLPERGGLLVADQFEESFTLCRNGEERKVFFERVLGLVERHRVVLTMRADFWGECAPYTALRQAMQARQELIPPMDAGELREAMERQAAAVGLRFEADLAATILDEVRGEPGAMPLLQHALLELWKARHGRWLKAGEYRRLGGVQRAIASTADAVFDGLTEPERERVRDIFVRLTRLDDGAATGADARDTRRRVPLANLIPDGADPAATKALIARLADARLLVVSGQGEGP